MGELVDAPFPPIDGTQPCAAEDPELFFPGSSSRDNLFSLPRALAVCEDCPFRRPCLGYALAWDVHGIWGGTTRPQRNDLRARYGITGRFVSINDAAAEDLADTAAIAQEVRGGEPSETPSETSD